LVIIFLRARADKKHRQRKTRNFFFSLKLAPPLHLLIAKIIKASSCNTEIRKSESDALEVAIALVFARVVGICRHQKKLGFLYNSYFMGNVFPYRV
jgi:hypothetical protein